MHLMDGEKNLVFKFNVIHYYLFSIFEIAFLIETYQFLISGS